MKAHGVVDVYIHVFLTSALVGCEWSFSRPGRFTPGKEPPEPIGKECGRTPGRVWTTWRIKNYFPHRDSNYDPSVDQPVASRYTNWAIAAP
jgi:hypothetical protein